MELNFKQHYFTLMIHSSACRYDVRMNGIPADRLNDGVCVDVDVPINPFVLSGANMFSATIRPADIRDTRFDPAARLEVSLCVRELKADYLTRKPIESFVLRAIDMIEGTGAEASPDFDGPNPPRVNRIDDLQVEVSRSTELQTPFPRWLWQDAEILTEDDRFDLLDAYNELHAALKAGDTGKVRELTDTKAAEMAKAYFGDVEEGHQLIDYLGNLANPDFILQDYDLGELDIELLAEGRLARLVDLEGHGPIFFRFTGEPIMVYMKSIYCKTKDKGFIQIR